MRVHGAGAYVELFGDPGVGHPCSQERDDLDLAGAETQGVGWWGVVPGVVAFPVRIRWLARGASLAPPSIPPRTLPHPGCARTALRRSSWLVSALTIGDSVVP